MARATWPTILVLAFIILTAGAMAQAGPPDQAGPPGDAPGNGPPDQAATNGDEASPATQEETPARSSQDEATSEEEASTLDEPDEPAEDALEPVEENAEPSTVQETVPEDEGDTLDDAPTDEEGLVDEADETTGTIQTTVDEETAYATPDQEEASIDPTTASDPEADDPAQDTHQAEERSEEDPAVEPVEISPSPPWTPDLGTEGPTAPPVSTMPPGPGSSENAQASSQGARSLSIGGPAWLSPLLLGAGLGAIAMVTLRQPRTQDPESPPERTSPAEAKEPSSQAPTVTPGIDGILLLGQNALDEGDIEDAIGWFETALAIKGDLQAAHFCLGLCLDDQGRLDEAADALDNAHGLTPEDPLTRYAYASVLARQGDTQQALKHAAYLADQHPALADTMLEDDEFAPLHDHPRLLALLGRL